MRLASRAPCSASPAHRCHSYFFLQAEDGIRDYKVTGVQTCALPIYEELGQEAQWHLESLANKHLHPMASAITHVRVGKPAEEILAEAKAQSVELIILPTYGPSFWNRLKGLWTNVCIPPVSTLAERVIREATCGVFV